MSFILGLILGIVIGGAGTWYYLNPPHGAPRADAIQQDAEAARQRPGEAAENAREELRPRLESLRLTAREIQEELKQQGKIVRRNAQELGTELKDAATDARITASIKAQYVRDPELSAWDITVSTTDRVVTLSGTVDSPELVGKAVLYALQTEGVHEVNSTLRIEGERL